MSRGLLEKRALRTLGLCGVFPVNICPDLEDTDRR